jgi:hypothetical protein
MSVASKSSIQAPRRIWKAPISKAWWIWLALSILLYGSILTVYLIAIQRQPFAGPFSDPLRSFGIIALVLVLVAATYSLRRRFVRGLPGMARAWLWMHIWIGITAILVAVLHENFDHIFRDYCQNAGCFTQAYGGTSALLALILLVASGIIGRLLDVWQAHGIARDASTNGVGIVQAIEQRILELEYTVERFSAGKSEAFKNYCMQALEHASNRGIPNIAPNEQADFQRAQETVNIYERLVQSLQWQNHARLIIRTWRYVHRVLACLALLIILYHGILELLTNVLHVIS